MSADQLELLRAIAAQLDEVLGKLSLVQTRLSRTETRLTRVCLHLGLDNKGEKPPPANFTQGFNASVAP